MKYKYIDHTANEGEPISVLFHAVIMAAIANNGIVPDEMSDLISVTKNPPGSSAEWSVNYI